MTQEQYEDFNEVALTPVIESVIAACSNYLDEMYSREKHIDKAEEALRLAMDTCTKYLNLTVDFRLLR